MITTDWRKYNRDLFAHYFNRPIFTAFANIAKAYHGGSNRAEMIQRLIRHRHATREELL